MLKSILFAIWAIASTLGVFYFMIFLGQEPTSAGEDAVSLTDHRTETMAVAVYRDRRIFGHLVTRVRYSAPSNIAADTQPPVSLLIEDALHDVVPKVDVEKLISKKDEMLDELGRELGKVINSRHPGLTIENFRFTDSKISVKKTD